MSVGALGAPQAAIVRATRKDGLHIKELRGWADIDKDKPCDEDMLRKACGAALGIQWSLAHETEVDLAADLLYRAITTGAGLPTLGEEFSEIIQVSKTREGHFISPGPLLRAQLVALECIGPYLSQKAILALSREHESQSSSHPVPRAMTGASDAQPFPATLSRSAEPTEPTRSHRRGSRASTSGLPGPKPAPPVPRALSEIPYWIVAVALHHARSVPRPLGTLVTLVQQWCSSLRASLSAGPYWLRRLARSLPTLLGAMSRLHLAAFYLHGDFLGVAKRIAGVRYAYVGRPLEPLPTYRILGWAVLLQLVFAAANAGAERALARKSASLGAVAKLRPDECPREGPAFGAARQTQAGVEPGTGAVGSPCPLCLGPRRNPASTPCGHVFCWECITEAGVHKAECPLCRQGFVLQDLAPVFHTAFQ